MDDTPSSAINICKGLMAFRSKNSTYMIKGEKHYTAANRIAPLSGYGRYLKNEYDRNVSVLLGRNINSVRGFTWRVAIRAHAVIIFLTEPLQLHNNTLTYFHYQLIN